jgi:uncharacterized protein (TIGR03118 family)
MKLTTCMISVSVCLTSAALADSQTLYQQDNLASNIEGVAPVTDPALRNPWGISFSATSPWWVSDTATGLSTLYSGDVNGVPFMKSSLEVTIPSAGTPPGSPTGQVFNGTSDFMVAGGPARFIFATLDGTISGWNSGSAASIAVTNPGAVYTGLAIGSNDQGNFLYAANVGGGTIDIFDGSFNPVTLGGSFTDPDLPDGYAPFNIQNLNGELYVTYENSNDPAHGGAVDVFDTSGNFNRRIAAGDPLNAPWGLALAPSTFGSFGGALLVGNFGAGDGRTSAFDPNTGDFLGQLTGADGSPIAIDGLWGLIFGNGGSGGDPNVLYFAAGINGQQDGLFGRISVISGARSR